MHSSPILVQPNGTHVSLASWNPHEPSALFPGSFNPLHDGHRRLAEIAGEMLGLPVAYEISVTNVDKPELDREEISRRVEAFVGYAPVWLTRAPRFVEKSVWFPRATFVVGADTAARLVAPKYYDGNRTRMLQALACLRSWECRFLVACRVDFQGKCWELADLPVPPEFSEMFAGIPSDRFRLDLSSTELRHESSRPRA